MSRMSPWAFSLFNVVGALVWAGGWTLLGYLAGARWERAHAVAGTAAILAVSLSVAGVALWRFARRRRAAEPDGPGPDGPGAGAPPPLWEVGLLGFAALLCAAAFAGLTLEVVAGRGLARVDPVVWAWAVENREPFLSGLLAGVTWLGSSPVLAGLVVLVGVWHGRRHGDWKVGVRLVVALAGILVLVLALKLLTGRVRPPSESRLTFEIGLAYPSGHAAQSLVVFSLLAALFARGRPGWQGALLWAAAVLGSLAVGFSRIYLGVHWLSDVVGGYLAGLVWLLVLAAASGLGRRRPAG